MSIVSAQQLAAFHATNYRVDAPDNAFVSHVGEHSLALQQLHAAYAVTSSAYLTAWNHLGESVASDRNVESQAALVRDLDALRVTMLPGEGRDPTSGWAEPSLLALGLSREQAIALGNQYQQLALLFSGPDAVPRLVLLR
jgi:hypothetical protein